MVGFKEAASWRDMQYIYFERDNDTLLLSDGEHEEEPFITLFPSSWNNESFFIFFYLGFAHNTKS